MRSGVVIGVLLACLSGVRAEGGCLLANASFEVGSGVDGWNAFNDVSIGGSLVVHGARGVRLGGAYTGGWAVSGVWQSHVASPGSVFDVSVWVGHDASDPLAGAARGIVNVEWRDAGEGLISYESHDVLFATDPTDEMTLVEIVTGAAPAGAASARLLLGMLQSPGQEPGRVVFDLAGFIERTTPTYDESQWGDFPGGRTILFGGRSWRVKGPGWLGPGPNWFSDSVSNVDVVGGELVMGIRGVPGAWSSAEITLEEALGYGDYVFTTRGRLDTLADNVVLGLFLWQYPTCYEPANTWNQHNEIDVEISRWGDPMNDVAQFVVQPYSASGNITRFDVDYSEDELVSYAFRWLPGRVEYRAWRGGSGDEGSGVMISSWVYSGQHLPRPEQPRVHVNLWHLDDGPSDGLEQSVVLEGFVFVPLVPSGCVGDVDGDGDTDVFDFNIFAPAFGASSGEPGYVSGADLDGNGVIDVFDFNVFAPDFGCAGS